MVNLSQSWPAKLVRPCVRDYFQPPQLSGLAETTASARHCSDADAFSSSIASSAARSAPGGFACNRLHSLARAQVSTDDQIEAAHSLAAAAVPGGVYDKPRPVAATCETSASERRDGKLGAAKLSYNLILQRDHTQIDPPNRYAISMSRFFLSLSLSLLIQVQAQTSASRAMLRNIARDFVQYLCRSHNLAVFCLRTKRCAHLRPNV